MELNRVPLSKISERSIDYGLSGKFNATSTTNLEIMISQVVQDLG